MDVEDIDEDVCDTVGRLANMLGGSIKNDHLIRQQQSSVITPSAIHGERVCC